MKPESWGNVGSILWAFTTCQESAIPLHLILTDPVTCPKGLAAKGHPLGLSPAPSGSKAMLYCNANPPLCVNAGVQLSGHPKGVICGILMSFPFPPFCFNYILYPAMIASLKKSLPLNLKCHVYHMLTTYI